MTDANGREVVPVRSLALVRVGAALVVLALAGFAALAYFQLDTRNSQQQDRIVINRFARSPCTGLTVVQCRRLLITPDYLARVLRSPGFKTALREATRTWIAGGLGASPGAAAPPPRGQAGGRVGTGTSGPRAPPHPTSTTHAQPQPEPEPAPARPVPPVAPLPDLPPIGVCVTTTLAGVCLP